jgi:hypothetical protein
MKEYTCEKCGKLFMHKHNHLHHTQRKKTCNPFFIEKQPPPINQVEDQVEDHIEAKDVQIYPIYNPKCIYPSCVYCNEIFSSNSARNRHMLQYCKMKKRYVELLEMYDKEIDNLVAENCFLKKTYLSLFGEKYLFPFGLEKFLRIDRKHIHNIIKEPISGMLQFIQDYHLNPKRIQFHNIRMNKDKHIEIYNGKRWEIDDIDNVIHQLLIIYKDTIEFAVDKINLSPSEYIMFSNHLDNIFSNKDEESSKYKCIINELKFKLKNELKN